MTLLIALCNCFSTLVLNATIGIVAWARYVLSSDGVAMLNKGSCTVTKWLNTTIHILINILSSLLLGVSNISMQLLVAPTRKKIDKAHRQGRWLGLRVLSFRNLRNLPLSSKIICYILALSSLLFTFCTWLSATMRVSLLPFRLRKLFSYDCLRRYDQDFGWRPHVLMISNNVDLSIRINSSVLMWELSTEKQMGE